MTVYLNPQNPSALGDDTFWTWFKREFPGSRMGLPKTSMGPRDIILQYSTLGFPNIAGKSLAVLWELYPQMKDYLPNNLWDDQIEKTNETARFCTWRTVATEENVKYYRRFGKIDVLPIGVDTDLFQPVAHSAKMRMRRLFKIPTQARVGFWIGTTHVMKGYSRLVDYAKDHPDIFWIVVWKWEQEAKYFSGGYNFTSIPQQQVADLMNCSDFLLRTSRLPSYYMAEWEAMACDLPIVYPGGAVVKDTRTRVFQSQWDRHTTKKLWENYLDSKGVKI